MKNPSDWNDHFTPGSKVMQDAVIALACTLLYQHFSLINRNYQQDLVQGQIGKSLSISHSVLDFSTKTTCKKIH